MWGVALDLLRFHPTDTQQYVTFENKISERQSVNCGTPMNRLKNHCSFKFYWRFSKLLQFSYGLPFLLMILRYLVDSEISRSPQFALFWSMISQFFYWLWSINLKWTQVKYNLIHFSKDIILFYHQKEKDQVIYKQTNTLNSFYILNLMSFTGLT